MARAAAAAALGRHALRAEGRASCRARSTKRSTRCEATRCCATGFGNAFVDYYCRIKEAEIARFNLEVSDWEHREYFDLF